MKQVISFTGICTVIGWLICSAVISSADGADAPKPADAIHELRDGSLKYLAHQQNGDGSWFVSATMKDGYSIAATSYSMLAFIAAGHTHQQGVYSKNVAAGLKFLLDHTGDDGFIQSGRTIMYDQGIATEVLAELYRQTQDESIKPKLQAAVKLIVKSQGQTGAWRYQPVPEDGDISITGFEIPALVAARKAGIEVPQETLDRAVRYLLACQSRINGGFSYTPNAGSPGYARTAAAVHSLLLLDKKDDPAVKAGLRFIADEPLDDDQWFAYSRFYMGGIRQILGEEQSPPSAKKVIRAVSRLAEKKDGEVIFGTDTKRLVIGPIYTTALCATILSMPDGKLTLYAK